MTEFAKEKGEDARWQAVKLRDPQSDGAFLYAVVTTGVYCRPVCSSKRPNRENVRFFDCVEDAERAGFRACKKCQPSSTARPLPEAVLQACQILDEADSSPSLDELAQAVGLSPHYLHRLFKKTVGVTPKAYSSSLRAERFRQELKRDQSVTSAMYQAGYEASSRCYEDVGNNIGMTPAEFRGGGSDQFIRYAIAPCQLGWVAVAATIRGVCMIELGDGPDGLRTKVSERFPNAVLEGEDDSFLRLVTDVIELIASPEQSRRLPLDVQGTAFQRKVWEALRSIPAGETTTYSNIAKEIGQPSAARAVASACGANPVAVAIPCHRVIRNDGDLSGYRWGVDRKRKLLSQEKAQCELHSKKRIEAASNGE